MRTRGALIASAADVFDRGGYARARLADISAGAGVSPGALHFHFENKAAVAEAVHTAAARTLGRAARLAYRERANTLQALTDITQAHARLLRRDVVSRAGFRLESDSTFDAERSIGTEWRRCVERLLAEAHAGRELAAGADLESATCTIVAATTGIAMLIDGADESRAQTALAGFWRAVHPEIAAAGLLARLDPAGITRVVDRAVRASGRPETAGRAALALSPSAG
ncbi:ScbR family autoregulator-binding transcription factor [Amorphoplanes digitatis]|uniref:AcrR family transcriptional regulator n=1 Tax=Actinoplanes digitatis TaxID=1868 RepID=A0A7W7MRN2_9ACTN|nr:ScbR family autoregulator-binding transcription factor [Actinoplanes digitatis]MBB4764451.1 AcrR family transcriptional regulator [Actinoplanes digitatis]